MISVQLYSLRDKTKVDFAATLEAVSKMGYDGVEFAGYGGISAEEMKSLLSKNRLLAAGNHVSFDLIKNDLDGVMKYNDTIECRNIVIPGSDASSAEKIQETVEVINRSIPILTANGFKLLYHNHDFEFKMLDGKMIIDMIFDPCPGLLQELDCCWLHVAGFDPAEYITKHADRIQMLHLKNYHRKNGEVILDNIGSGEVDIKGVIMSAIKSGITKMVVENDRPQVDSLVDVETSLDYFKEVTK